MPALLNDLRFGLRMLRKDIGATTLSVLSIGLGIGAATAIFSVANAVLFEPFPYKGVDRIVSFQIHPLKEGAKRFSFSISDYLKIQQESRVFEDTFAMGFEPLRLTGGSEPELIWGKLFGPNAFDFLGVRPLLGRTFLPEDYGSGGAPKRVAVLSYLLWQRRFGGDHGVLGREVLLNGKSHTVIGVMPPRFTIYTAPGQMAIWLPLALDRSQERLVTILGRLAPGVSEETASKELHAIFSRVAQVNPDHFPDQGFTVAIFRFTRFVRDWIRNTVFILLAATGLLLLIACSNVANLLLVRASARTREMAVRLSVGALRRNLLSQLLSESLMLSLTGGALGVALAYWGTKALLALLPPAALPSETTVHVNARVLAFSLVISVLTGILFGLAPAIHASRLNLNVALKDAGRGSPAGLYGNRTRNGLVVFTMAFAMILLVGAGLMIQTFIGLKREHLGFQTENILTMQIPLESLHPEYDQRIAFCRQVLDRVERLPGVTAVAVVHSLPPWQYWRTHLEIAGQTPSDELQAAVGPVSSDYFRAMGIPLLKGQAFSKEEVSQTRRVAVINQAAASRFFPDGTDPVGQRVRLAVLERESPWTKLPSHPDPWVSVIGIVANSKNDGLREQPRPAIYVPFTLLAPAYQYFAIRTVSDPNSLLKTVRSEILAINKDQPVTRVGTMSELMERERATMVLLSVFAGVGLILAAAGIYGVMSYSVSQRSHEIGMRVALGARAGDVVRLVLFKGLGLACLGAAGGAIGSVALTRLISAQLHGIEPTEPLVVGAVAILLVGVALVASYIPAHRAATVDPLLALRYE